MSDTRKDAHFRMLKRFGTRHTVNHLMVVDSMSHSQALHYCASLAKPKPLTPKEEARLIAFINNY